MGLVNSSGRTTTEAAADWSFLPPDLLRQFVARRLTNIADHIRFRAVCVSWRLTVSPEDFIHPQTPWLMLPTREEGTTTISFFDLSNPRHSLYTLDYPATRERRIIGASHGWLVLMSNEESEILCVRTVSLLNPITREQVLLPLLPMGFNARFIKKLVLCSNLASPRPHELLVVVLTSKDTLGFLKQGNEDWTLIESSPTGTGEMVDIMYLDNKVYVMDSYGRLAVLQADSFEVSMLIHMPPILNGSSQDFNLVEVAGDLFLIRWHYDELTPLLKMLSVFKLDGSRDGQLIWASIGVINITLPFGYRSPFVQELPDREGYRIYLADGSCNSKYDVCAIDVKDGIGSVEQPSCQVPDPVRHGWPSEVISYDATWIVPSLH